MTRRKLLPASAVALVFALTTLSVGLGLAAGDDESEDILIKLLGHAKVSLQQALVTSEREGQPISGKFEVEDGKLQLSIYTAKDTTFFEVIVDHMTGDIGRADRGKGGP